MRCAALLILLMLIVPAPAHAQLPAPGVAHEGVVPPPDDALPALTRASIAAASRTRPGAATRTDYVPLAWPIGRALDDHLDVVNYVDHDPTAGVLDYSGGTWSYDAHSGTDIALTDFRLMDRGTTVRAAAPGVVTYMSDTSVVDRSCTFDWPDGGNWIWIQAADGTFHEYYHLRRSSVAVKLGDAVTTGQFLGMIGSSGYTTIPHLHFEAGAYDGPGAAYQPRDPFHGSNNALASLWAAPQPAYAGAAPIHMLDMGVYAESQVGGNLGYIQYCDILSPLPKPVTFGTSENYIGMWFHFQTRAADTMTVTLRRPDGSVYGSFDSVASQQDPVGWFWAYYYFGGQGPGSYGLWRVQTTRHGVLLGEHTFTVAATTTFAPRFWPRAGRSFRLRAATQRDTLRRYFQSPAVTYALVGAPANVTLGDSVLTVGPPAQTTRSRYFTVVMTDAQARKDTAYYHLVDLTKVPDPAASVAPLVLTTLRMAASPQPFHDRVALAFSLPAAGDATITIHDLAGRRVRTLVHGPQLAGAQVAPWDGRDERGRSVGAGVYYARLVTGSGSARTTLVRF